MNWNPEINSFKTYLKLERSLSANTVEAYLRDITKFTEYLQIKELDLSPKEIVRENLVGYINSVSYTHLTLPTILLV